MKSLTETFTVTNADDVTTTTVTITIDGVNDAPNVVAIDLGNIDEDNSRLISQADLLAGSSDTEGDGLTVLNLALASGSGTLTDNGDGTWTFDPTADWSGAVGFTFDVDDGTDTTANTAALTVDPVNDAPTVVAIDLGNIDEDNSRLITPAELLAGSSDTEGDGLTVLNLALASGSGTLTDNGDGTWTFDPTADWSGAVGFTFDVDDGTDSTANTAALMMRRPVRSRWWRYADSGTARSPGPNCWPMPATPRVMARPRPAFRSAPVRVRWSITSTRPPAGNYDTNVSFGYTITDAFRTTWPARRRWTSRR